MATFLLIISLFTFTQGQDAKSAQASNEQVKQVYVRPPKCPEYPAAKEEPLIREAEVNQYTFRRVEFLGNVHIRDYVLRRPMYLLTEGEVFTRKKLVRSLAKVNRLSKIIYPVKLSNVDILLDKERKEVDMTICFQEKHRVYHGARRR